MKTCIHFLLDAAKSAHNISATTTAIEPKVDVEKG